MSAALMTYRGEGVAASNLKLSKKIKCTKKEEHTKICKKNTKKT